MKTIGENNLGGRPQTPEEQYEVWLEELRPFLVKGMKLYSACVNVGLEDKYYSCIYQKYRLRDWFSKKIHEYWNLFGDTINDFFANEVFRISDKQCRRERLTKEDLDIMKFMASNHRTAQPFFTRRVETRKAKDNETGKVIEPAKMVYVKPKLAE